VIRGFVTSAEYHARHPGSVAYVSALYQDLLGRAADATGLANWVNQLAGGLTSQQLVQTLQTSAEGWQQAIQATYSGFLHRAADGGGDAFWLAQLLAGRATLSAMTAAILSSGEYFQLAASAG
jgi:hypothetical protein